MSGAKGWKDIFWRIYENLSEHRVIAIAAGVAFYALLAIFPALAAFVALYGLFADPATIRSHLNDLSNFMPGGAVDVIDDQVRRIAAQGNRALGFAFILGLGISLWSANAGVKALFDALNIVYREKEKRGFIKFNAVSLGFTFLAITLVLLAIAAMVVLPPALEYLGITAAANWAIKIARWPVLLIVVSIGIAFIYRHGPSREEAQWRWISLGSAFATLAWLAISLLFSWYAQNFGSYNKTYGSLGAVIGFMTWIWLSTIMILIGAELDAAIGHQAAGDTTSGQRKLMGSRGATMADTVDAARS